MASLKFTSWLDGINTRVNKFRIKLTEAVDAVNVNLSGLRLKPDKGLNTSNTASGDYNFKGDWVTDGDATKFTESGDILIKSYDNATPKFDRRYYDSSGNFVGLVGEKTLGSPEKPTSKPSVSISTTGSSTGTGVYAQSSIFTESFGTSTVNATSNSGLYADVLGSDDSNATIFKVYNTILVAVNKSTGLIRRRTLTTGALPVADVTLTHKNKVFIHGGYVVGLDSGKQNISVVAAESGTTEYTYSIANPTFQTTSSSTYKHGYVSIALKSSSFTINNGNLFVARNYEGNLYRDYQVPGVQSVTGQQVYFGDHTPTWPADTNTTKGTPLTLIIYPASVGNNIQLGQWNANAYYDTHTSFTTGWGATYTRRIYGIYRDITINSVAYKALLIWRVDTGFPFSTIYRAGHRDDATNPFNLSYTVLNAWTRLRTKTSVTADQGYWTFLIHPYTVTSLLTDDYGWQNWGNTANPFSNQHSDLSWSSGSRQLTISHSGSTQCVLSTDSMEWTSGASKVGGSLRQFDYVGGKPIMGTMTKMNLSSFVSGGGGSNGVTHSLIDKSNTLPLPKGNIWGWRKNSTDFTTGGGWDNYQETFLPDITSENDEIQPLRSNFLATLQKRTFDYTALSGNSAFDATSGKTQAVFTHLVPEGSHTLSAIDSTSADLSHGDVTPTSITPKFMTYQAVGSGSSNDRIFFGTRFTGNSFSVYKNETSSGGTQFGSGAVSLTLNITGYDVEKQDTTTNFTHRITFINSAETSGSNINVVSLTDMSLTTGATTFGVTNGKDIWIDGTKRIIKIADNSLSVIDTSNNNEASAFHLPFGYWLTSTDNGTIHYGLSLDGSSNDEINGIKKCYAFWMHEVLGLTTGGILNHDASKNRNISKIVRKTGTNNRHMYIIFNDTSSNFTYDNANFKLNIDTNRRPLVVATASTEVFTGTISATTKIVFPASEVYSTMIHDNVSVVHGGNTDSRTVTAKGSTSGTEFTVNTALTGNPTSGSATVTRTRYVHKNRFYIPNQYYNDFVSPTLVVADFSSTDYASNKYADEQIALSGISSLEFITVNKSSSNESEADELFYIDVEKNTVNASSLNDLGSSLTYTTAGVNLHNPNGPLIPFQYKYSYLRDISHASESELLIEGPTSEESSKLTTSELDQFIPFESISGVPSEVTKIRLYRVGGDYSRYYWLADLPVTGGSTQRYLDKSMTVGSTLITPLADTGNIPTTLKNIIYVNGVYMGSDGSKIYFSRYGDPNNWPEFGFQELEGDVTNMLSYQGEGLIFTRNATFRVRGSNYDQMQIIKVPDRQGVPTSNYHSVLDHKGSVYFISNDGLCVYSNGAINVISSQKFESFPVLGEPKSAIKDNVLYVFEGNQSSLENGVKLDTRAGTGAFSRISQKALGRAFYDQITDRLYLTGSGTSGSYLDGSDESITWESGDYTGGNTETFNAFYGYKMTYSTSEAGAQIQFFSDGGGDPIHTKTIPHSTTVTSLFDQFTNYVVAKSLRYKLTGKITVFGMEVNYDSIESFPMQRRFEYADVQYRGSALQINMSVDNTAQTMSPNYSSTNLPSAGDTRNIRLYYPADTTGTIPHYYSSGTGEVISVNYQTADL